MLCSQKLCQLPTTAVRNWFGCKSREIRIPGSFFKRRNMSGTPIKKFFPAYSSQRMKQSNFIISAKVLQMRRKLWRQNLSMAKISKTLSNNILLLQIDTYLKTF